MGLTITSSKRTGGRIRVLTADEQPAVKYHSSISQHKNKLSVMQRGEWVPISFDVLDWIDCETGIKSHRAIVTDGDDIGFEYKVEDEKTLSDYYLTHNYDVTEYGAVIYAAIKGDKGFLHSPVEKCLRIGLNYALADDTLQPEDAAGMHVLTADEQPEVFYKSSISQHKNKLSIMQRGEWVPISFDSLDYISCDGIKSHRAIVTDGDDIGYEFKVEDEVLLSDTYITSDVRKLVTETLPAWFGTGEYQKFVEARAYTNSDIDSLGHRTENNLRIGLNYALATKTLEADD